MTSNSEAQLRVGVFGVGSLGQHHARIYSELDNADLVGVYDINPDRAREIAARHGVEPFTDMDALAGKIDAASVAVPTDKHYDIFNRLIEHDLHLLVEKPIAARTEEAERMVRTAQERGCILQVGHVERFNPVMQFLEDNLTQARFIEATRLAPYPPPRPGAPPRGTEVSVVLDLMIHDLDIILHIVRSPLREIHATGVPVLSPSEDIANVRLIFENGCVANVTASRISVDKMRKIRVFQPDTYVSLDYMNQTGMLHRKQGMRIEAIEVPIEKGEPLANELSSFVQCVIHRRNPVVSGEHGWQAMKLAVDICRTIQDNPS